MLAQKIKTDVVQSLVDFSLAWLEDRNYSLVVDVDMGRWSSVAIAALGSDAINPTFNPRINALTAKNCFWLDIRAGSSTIAAMAARLFVTEDYMELKRSMRLWRDSPPPGELAIMQCRDVQLIRGRVGHEGGLWIHPDHRKRGLSTILPHLMRALCLRQWNIDWQTGVTRGAIGDCGIAVWAYGMKHVDVCFEGYFPITKSYDRLSIAYMSRDEIVTGLDIDAVAGLLPNHHAKPIHLVARVKEG
jgi:hypothetical protein